MTRHTHRSRATLLVRMASIGILLALYGCDGGDDPSPSTQFTLSGQVNRSGTFTRADLQTFSSTTQSQGPVPGAFTGVSLWALLTDAKGGGDLTTNPQVRNDFLRKYVVVTGSDGTKAVVAVGEIHPNFGNQPDLVAYDVNGQPLGDDGFAQLVVPRDQSGGRYVVNLVSLEVRGSTAPQVSLGGGIAPQSRLSGDVRRSSTFTPADLQRFPTVTQNVTFRSGQNTVTGSFTGVSLWTLLTDANGGGGIITNAQGQNASLRKYVVATGSDGYQAVVALSEIDPQFGNQPVLIAVAFNGGSLDQNGLTRLVVPGDIFGGRYVSNLVSLEVFDADTSP
jgi:Oxidoreductase molybdopterin binding domain